MSKLPELICIKWNGTEYKISGLTETAKVLDLKEAIFKETGVLASRQKILGLKYNGMKFFLLFIIPFNVQSIFYVISAEI